MIFGAMENEKTAIVILAAGPSSRLGEPKQLVIFKGETLLRRLAQNAVLASKNVFVVLGAHENLIAPTLENLPVQIIKNPRWATGMASSIATGLAAAMAQVADLEGVIFSVCDQPRLSAAVFQKIISQKNLSKKGIVACGYGGSAGVPVLFSKKYFPKLLLLEGEKGAKNLIRENPGDLDLVDFPGGDWDIDELRDLPKNRPKS